MQGKRGLPRRRAAILVALTITLTACLACSRINTATKPESEAQSILQLLPAGYELEFSGSGAEYIANTAVQATRAYGTMEASGVYKPLPTSGVATATPQPTGKPSPTGSSAPLNSVIYRFRLPKSPAYILVSHTQMETAEAARQGIEQLTTGKGCKQIRIEPLGDRSQAWDCSQAVLPSAIIAVQKGQDLIRVSGVWIAATGRSDVKPDWLGLIEIAKVMLR